ncbi:MAG: anthranilate synthase component I family protein [Myxococcales bacterium]|nr:anthranilate synthase component I family protein [Myxococcales bacterium]
MTRVREASWATAPPSICARPSPRSTSFADGDRRAALSAMARPRPSASATLTTWRMLHEAACPFGARAIDAGVANLYASDEFLRQLLTKAVAAGASDIQDRGHRAQNRLTVKRSESLASNTRHFLLATGCARYTLGSRPMATERPIVTARVLCVTPDPIGIARAFAHAGLEHVALLHAAEPPSFGAYRSFIGALPDRESCAFDPSSDDDLALVRGPLALGPLGAAPRWIGVLPYEAARARLERATYAAVESRPAPLVCHNEWRRYPAVICVDHARHEVLAVGTSDAAIDALVRALGRSLPGASPISAAVRDADPPEHHLRRVERALELIVAGDLYQVNLARRLDVMLDGAPLDVYEALARSSPGAWGGALALSDGTWALSTSPELLLLAESDGARVSRLYSEPIKGTRPRGEHALMDAALRDELATDAKERAELSMIIDVVRNDLGKASVTGSVKVVRQPHVVAHRTVFHRKSLLMAHARADASRALLLTAMVPSGSVTGAPKIRAMEVVRQLEGHRRGLYTGGFGSLAHNGTLTLAIAIRTLVMREQLGHYFTGGGIVIGSEPARELAETAWKARQLEALCRGPTTPRSQ